MTTISPERLAVLQAAADVRLFWLPGSPAPSSIMRTLKGRRTMDVTPAANWLRSHGLIRVINGGAAGDGRRFFTLTPLGRETLESGTIA
jgi:hypothetical protein